MAEIRIDPGDLAAFQQTTERIKEQVSSFRDELVASVTTVAGLAATVDLVTGNLDKILKFFEREQLTPAERDVTTGFAAGVRAALPAAELAAVLGGVPGAIVGAGLLAAGGATAALAQAGETRRRRELDRFVRDVLRRKQTTERITELNNVGRIRATKTEVLLRRMRRGS